MNDEATTTTADLTAPTAATAAARPGARAVTPPLPLAPGSGRGGGRDCRALRGCPLGGPCRVHRPLFRRRRRSPSLSGRLAADSRGGDRQVGPRDLVAGRYFTRPRGGAHRDRPGGPPRLDGDRPRRIGRRSRVGGVRDPPLPARPVAIGRPARRDNSRSTPPMDHRWRSSSGNLQCRLRRHLLQGQESRRRSWVVSPSRSHWSRSGWLRCSM